MADQTHIGVAPLCVFFAIAQSNSSVGFREHHILQMDGFNMFLSFF